MKSYETAMIRPPENQMITGRAREVGREGRGKKGRRKRENREKNGTDKDQS